MQFVIEKFLNFLFEKTRSQCGVLVANKDSKCVVFLGIEAVIQLLSGKGGTSVITNNRLEGVISRPISKALLENLHSQFISGLDIIINSLSSLRADCLDEKQKACIILWMTWGRRISHCDPQTKVS